VRSFIVNPLRDWTTGGALVPSEELIRGRGGKGPLTGWRLEKRIVSGKNQAKRFPGEELGS